MDNANLCSEHCAFGSSSVETHPVTPPALDLVALPWRAPVDVDTTAGAIFPDWRLARSTAPPSPILFGALRI